MLRCSPTLGGSGVIDGNRADLVFYQRVYYTDMGSRISKADLEESQSCPFRY